MSLLYTFANLFKIWRHKGHPGSLHRGATETNSTRNHEVLGSILGLTQWVTGLAFLWLWHRPAAVSPIRPLAWEPPYATYLALKRKKKKKRKKSKHPDPPGCFCRQPAMISHGIQLLENPTGHSWENEVKKAENVSEMVSGISARVTPWELLAELNAQQWCYKVGTKMKLSSFYKGENWGPERWSY